MKQPHDLARRFLALADRDLKTLRQLTSLPDSEDEAIGFHAQQAVEKSLKAVLALHGIPFRKTHDLSELMDLLTDHGRAAPPNAAALDTLSPFAVIFRYDVLDVEGFDRRDALGMAEVVRRWAGEQIPPE